MQGFEKVSSLIQNCHSRSASNRDNVGLSGYVVRMHQQPVGFPQDYRITFVMEKTASSWAMRLDQLAIYAATLIIYVGREA